jgi:NAD(P)-dependent dehydrogenase (short-subunit alcohol dehydrogenase family)
MDRLWENGWSILALVNTASPPLPSLPERLQQGQTFSFFARPIESSDFAYDFRAHLYDLLDASDLSPDLLVVAHGAKPVITPTITDDAADALEQVFQVDVLGAFHLCQAVGRRMLENQHGTIVLISSLHAYQTYPERIPYVVAKTAMCGLARGLAVDWGRYGIRTNAILPWQVTGARTQTLANAAKAFGEDLLEAYRQKSPMRRLIEPEDIAEAVLWLERTPSANGMEVVLDGGVAQSMWYKPFLEES